jgi:hypothetical protein
VRHLEEEVAQLEQELDAIRSQNGNDLDNVQTAVERLTTSLARIIADPSGRARKHEQIPSLVSRYFLSDSPSPYLGISVANPMSISSDQSAPERAIALSSIPRQVVDAMLTHFCETYRPQYPSLAEEDLYGARDKVYNSPDIVGYDAFIVYITLAISSNTLMHIDEKRATTTTSGLWKTAIFHLQEVGLTSSWERLQALQLLTHFGFLNPQHVNVSHCAAAATRLAFQLGLHEELPASMQTTLGQATLNARRRMFWNAYGIDACVASSESS